MKTGGKGNVAQMLRDHLRPGQVAFDVGAAYGEMTKTMLEAVGAEGHVHAIEADPGKQERFWRTVGEHRRPQVTHWATAVGETTGPIALRGVHTAMSRWHGDVHDLTVPMTTLDAIWEQDGEPDVAVVKMDIQGSESHALDGAHHLLRHCPCWIVELWPWGLATAGRSAQQVIQQFRAAGLTPCWPKGEPITDEDLETWAGPIGRPSGEMVNLLAHPSNTHTNLLARR